MVLLSRLHARFAIAALALVAALFGLASPLFQKLFVDRLMGLQNSFGFEAFAGWPTWMFIVVAFVSLLIGSAANVYAVWTGAKEGNIIQARLGEMLYAKMLRMRTDQLGHKPIGEVVALYATDVQGATLVLEEALPMVTSTLFPLLFAPIAVHLIAGIPLWWTVLLSIAIIVLNLFLARRQSRFFYYFKHLAAERVGIVAEWIQNMRLLRILGWTQSFESKIQRKRIEETTNRIAMVTNGQFMSSIGSSVSFFVNLCGIASLIFLSGKAINPSELLALLWIFGVFLARPFRQVPWMFTIGMDGMTSIKRLEIFFNGPDEGESPAVDAKEAVNQAPAALEVKNLRLKIGEQPLLNGIDLSVAKGEWVAIVGEVGSGKTLLLLSLMGEAGASFDQFDVNGRSVLDWAIDKRRALFSFVPQEGFVMSASLRENVALEYNHSAENDALILQSLELAQFNIDRESVGGLGAEIGERGVNLSGGQRQRVSLARAEYFSRPILLLDDCLSAVDIETERNLVAKLLRGSWEGRTRVLVTHRLTVLEHVDRIVFLENGTIEAIGKFDELLKKNAKFKAFAASVTEAPATESSTEQIAAIASAEAQSGETEDLSAET